LTCFMLLVSSRSLLAVLCSFFFQAEDGIRDRNVTGVQTCALPILSLLLLVIISLLAACIQSSRVSCARAQAANAMGAAMYSLFAQYDRDLLEDYHLFFLDSGYGDSRPNLAQVIAQTETFALPILSYGLTNCEL